MPVVVVDQTGYMYVQNKVPARGAPNRSPATRRRARARERLRIVIGARARILERCAIFAHRRIGSCPRERETFEPFRNTWHFKCGFFAVVKNLTWDMYVSGRDAVIQTGGGRQFVVEGGLVVLKVDL